MTTASELLALAPPSFDARGDSNYAPCRTGIHLCGAAAGPGGHEQPYSAINLPARSADEARAMYAAAKAEAECGQDAEDFICDLMIDGDVIEDFYTNRQLAPRLIAAARAAQMGA